ncbi:MAG: ATP-grasp domain-containing protein [Catenulispora sp.]|nr:ATP-grasp domain-containing protein [Catenulispora sp.]
MIQSLVLVTQNYLHFAGRQTLADIASRVRLSIVLEPEEVLNPHVAPYIAEVHRLKGRTERNLQPSFDAEDLAALARREIAAAGGDPHAVRLFCQHEDNVLPTAQARAATGIPGDGPDLVSRFRDKILMKEALADKFPDALPKYRPLAVERAAADAQAYYAELVAQLGTRKLVVKPTCGAGSLNVAIITGPQDLRAAAERIQTDERAFDYEVDEFLEGTMHQCDSFVRDGEVIFSGILELGCSNFDFVQGKPLSVYPVTDPGDYQRLFDFNQAVVTALGFRDGSVHHELFVRRDPDGVPVLKFVEIAARVPGGLGVPFHERNSGINLIDENLRLALGAAERPGFRIRNDVVSALLPVGHGTVVALNEPKISSEYSIAWRVAVGDVVDSRSLIDNAGILTLTNSDAAVLRRDFESLQQYVPVTCG